LIEIKRWKTKLNFNQNPKSIKRHCFEENKKDQTIRRLVTIYLVHIAWKPCLSDFISKAFNASFLHQIWQNFARKRWPDTWLHLSVILSSRLTPQQPRRYPKVANPNSLQLSKSYSPWWSFWTNDGDPSRSNQGPRFGTIKDKISLFHPL